MNRNKKFQQFLESVSYYDMELVNSVFEAYGLIFEAVSINKEYLLKLSGSPEKFNEIKNKVNGLWNTDQMSQFIPKADKILPFLYLQEIKAPNSVDKSTMKFLHDLSSAGQLNTLDKLNSDTTPEQFKQFIQQGSRNLQNLGDLSPEEEETWLRVKVFHDFGDGYQWVVALDKDGNVSGFMPSLHHSYVLVMVLLVGLISKIYALSDCRKRPTRCNELLIAGPISEPGTPVN